MTLAAVARSLPGCGAVDVVDVENSAVAVDTSFPVCGRQRVTQRYERRLKVRGEECDCPSHRRFVVLSVCQLKCILPIN